MLLGSTFEHFLKGHTCQDAVFREEWSGIFRLYRDDHTAIGKRGVTSGEAHTVNDHLVVLRGSRHDKATWAHAE